MKVAVIFILAWAIQFGSQSEKLGEYESLSHFDVEKYTTQYSRSFDESGIIVQSKEYHPLTICMYGIICYDHFKSTGDSIYYYRFLNQYKFFDGPGNVVYSDSNQCAGLPYRFDAQGMKAPWYSGMTQGVAVSYLLRYHELTGDKNALILSEKLVRLMLKDEKDGGTLSRTPEGGMWIEEYPNNAKSKSVLNGFINAFIGLHEYCIFFPKDKKASEVRDSCYKEFIENVWRYDTPNWTAYSRHGTPISNSYLRYQLEELDHLYSMFGDVRLRHQMRIWAKLAFNRPDNDLKILKLQYYQFGIALSGDPAADSCVYNNYIDFAKGMVAVAPRSTRKNSSSFKFKSEAYFAEVKLLTAEMNPDEVIIHASKNGQVVPVTFTYSTKRIVVESSVAFNELELIYPKQQNRKACPVAVNVYDHKTCELALFGFYELRKKESLMQGTSYRFTYVGKNLTNARVFYRYSPIGVKPEVAKYSMMQSFDLANESFTAPGTGTYQFFISYDLVHPESMLSKLTLVTQ